MNTQTAANLFVFGIFVVLLGAMGYLTHPQKAQTALLSGGVFGGLMILWSVLGARGARWSWPAALGTTVLLGGACLWRAGLGWSAVVNGQTEKAFASMIITLMLGVAAIAAVMLLKEREPGKPDSNAQR